MTDQPSRRPFFRVMPPDPRHVEGLLRLSTGFRREPGWSTEIPLRSIDTTEKAWQRLMGANVLAARVAENEQGEVVGFTGVVRYDYEGATGVEASLLVAKGYRRSGVGRALVEAAFAALPPGLRVEAWVLAENIASMAATPRMGFTLDRVIEDEGREVHIFIRET